METLDDSASFATYGEYQNAIQHLYTWGGDTINLTVTGSTISETTTIVKDEVDLLGDKLKELGK